MVTSISAIKTVDLHVKWFHMMRRVPFRYCFTMKVPRKTYPNWGRFLVYG
jgi:hypothetical protein